MKYIILEKSHVKSHVRTRHGKLERVAEHERRVPIFHGTEISSAKKILKQGILPQKYHNYHPSFYKGNRANKVFVTKSLTNAIMFARTGRANDDEKSIVIKAMIPKKFWDSNAKIDDKTNGHILPKIKPEWITNVWPIYVKSKDYSLEEQWFEGDKKNIIDIHSKLLKKSDSDNVIVYIPLSLKTLKRIIGIERE